MKFLIIGDLHGHKPNIFFKEFDAIIAPGDFCSDAPRVWMFKSLKEKLQNPKTTTHWYELVGKRKAKKMIEQSIMDGRSILEYLNSFNVPVYCVPGNWDWTPAQSTWVILKQNHWQRLIKGLKNVIDCHHKRVDIGHYNFIGHGITSGPEYPQDAEEKETARESSMIAKIKSNYKRQKSVMTRLFQETKKPIIFMPHNVPYNTPLDLINNPASPRNGKHFGSVIAREMIDRYQPLVCIGGHMHEQFTACTLGKTLCINAGFGSDVNVLLEIDGSKIKKVEFCKKGKIVQVIN